jgi:tRNA(fMet)-specific endonuclease VapC
VRFLLDTNALAEPVRPNPSKRFMDHFRRQDGTLAISAITWHEAEFGLLRMPLGKRRRAVADFLEEVIRPTMPVLPYDDAAASWHAAQRARLASRGRTPSFIDGQIAAVAAANGLVLVTANTRHFAPFTGLSVVDWR